MYSNSSAEYTGGSPSTLVEHELQGDPPECTQYSLQSTQEIPSYTLIEPELQEDPSSEVQEDPVSGVQEDPHRCTLNLTQSTQEVPPPTPVEHEVHEDPVSGVQEDPSGCTLNLAQSTEEVPPPTLVEHKVKEDPTSSTKYSILSTEADPPSPFPSLDNGQHKPLLNTDDAISEQKDSCKKKMTIKLRPPTEKEDPKLKTRKTRIKKTQLTTQKNKITDMLPKLMLTSTNNDTEAEKYDYNIDTR